MKTYFIAVCLFLFSTTNLIAQSPGTHSSKGHWQIESNVRHKNNVRIQFYDASQNLVYEERVAGWKIKIHKRKTQVLLRGILEELMARNMQPQASELPTGLVAIAFRKKDLGFLQNQPHH